MFFLTRTGSSINEYVTQEQGYYDFIKNKVIDGSNTYQYNVRKLIIPDLTCTLTDAMMDIVNDSCGCGSKELIEDWLEGFAYVEALKGAAICGDISQFSTLYENAQNYLNDLNCNC